MTSLATQHSPLATSARTITVAALQTSYGDDIQANIDNAEFSVENLADLLNISRIQLYRKIKAMFDVNVSDYISNIRLVQAKSMLQNPELTISEIAYKTGFSSPNYFSTVFKNKFGVSPNVYRKSAGEE